MRALVVCLAAGCASGSAPAPERPAQPSATEIVEQMARTYAAARTYRDRGTSTSVHRGGDRRHVQTFETAFARPDRFRFEYRDDDASDRAHTVWLADGAAYSRWYARPAQVQVNSDLATPLGAAAGVSNGLSMIVPSMLLPELGLGGFHQRLSNLRLDGHESVGGRPCWRVQANHDDQRVTLAIDRASHVLRRVRYVYRIVPENPKQAAFDVDQTIELDARIDEPIDPVALRGPDISTAQLVKPSTPTWIAVRFAPDSTTLVQVLSNGPAAQAGLRAGDRIVSFDGSPVTEPGEVIRRVQQHAPGERVAIVIERAGAQLALTLDIEARPEARALQRAQLLDAAAPDFSLATLDGKTVTLSKLKGRVVILDFWATWCQPCIAQLPHLRRIHDKLGPRGLVIVGLTSEDPALVRPFVATHKLAYPIALDPDHDVWGPYLVQGIPTTIIIDKAGIVRFVDVGLGDPAIVDAAIRQLLK